MHIAVHQKFKVKSSFKHDFKIIILTLSKVTSTMITTIIILVCLWSLCGFIWAYNSFATCIILLVFLFIFAFGRGLRAPFFSIVFIIYLKYQIIQIVHKMTYNLTYNRFFISMLAEFEHSADGSTQDL